MDCLVVKGLKHWTANLEVVGSGPTGNRDFSLQGILSPDPKIEEKGYTFMSFGGDTQQSVSRDLVSIGSCLLQALISHHCSKPLRGDKTKQTKYCGIRPGYETTFQVLLLLSTEIHSLSVTWQCQGEA